MGKAIDCTLKNWLFNCDVGAGDRSAIMFTIIEACRRRSIVSVKPSPVLRS
jgi:hypothetical protein